MGDTILAIDDSPLCEDFSASDNIYLSQVKANTKNENLSLLVDELFIIRNGHCFLLFWHSRLGASLRLTVAYSQLVILPLGDMAIGESWKECRT